MANIFNASDFAGESPEEQPVRAKLKWFNGPKGFGFVVPVDKNVDAFLHVTTLQRAGASTLGEGADILCCITYGSKGAMVTEVTKIINHGIVPADQLELTVHSRQETAPNQNENQTSPMQGTVKWYRTDKGFGFVLPEDGGKDVFVHKACLDSAGISHLEPGQRVRISMRTVKKGREATDISLINDVDGNRA